MVLKRIFYKNQNEKAKRAFSLTETTVVIAIAATMMVSAVAISSGIDTAKVKVSNIRLEQINKSLGSYLQNNKKLPCPAAINLAKTDSSYGKAIGSDGSCAGSGVYQSSSNSTLVYGMLPVADLGLSADMAEDGFENKFAYIVNKNFTDSSTFFTATGDIVIKEKPGSSAQTIESAAIYAIISYGANKSGAFPASLTIQNPRSSDSVEQDNDAASFVNGSPGSASFDNVIYVSAKSSDSFDDVVKFRSKNAFLIDFNISGSIQCPPISSSLASATYTWPAGRYNEIVVANENCPVGWYG